MYRMICLLIPLAFLSTNALARDVDTSMHFFVDTHGDVDPKQSIHGVVFTDEDAVAGMEFGLYRLEEHPAKRKEAEKAHITIPERWWESARWDVRTEEGAPVAVVPRVLSNSGKQGARETLVVVEGEHVGVRMSLGRFTPGAYVVTLTLAVPGCKPLVATDKFWVRSGNEDSIIQRIYIRAKLGRTSDFSERRDLWQQLSRLEPSNVEPFERLADESIGHVPEADTLQYYDRALSVYETDAADWYKTHPKSANDDLQTGIARIRKVKDLLPLWSARKQDLEIRIITFAGRKHYNLVRRGSGELVRSVD